MKMQKSEVYSFGSEKLNWLKSLFEERFGVAFNVYSVNIGPIKALRLSIEDSESYIEFGEQLEIFHRPGSDLQCASWNPRSEGFFSVCSDTLPVPGLAHLALPLIRKTSFGFHLGYDLLGFIYWMLSRVEEIDCVELDEHGRFPSTSSHAYKYGYLDLPIVDEWFNILRQLIKRVWPSIKLREHEFRINLTHDVDAPARYAFGGWGKVLRTMTGDVIHRRDIKSALLGPWLKTNSKKEIHPCDPVNLFDWIMNLSEKNGLNSAFYFICGRTDPYRDALYDIGMPQIRSLLRKIYSRGHEIGLHPSYNTYLSPEKIRGEFEALKDVCFQEGIAQPSWGGRMHFLRWDHSVTLRAWDDAGINYDSTLGYADRPGFRCGTCFEYTAFDASNNQPLQLRIRPLIAMDCSVIADRYMGLGPTDEALDLFNLLKYRCKSVKGVFTLLWHNSYFPSSEYFDLYRRLVCEN